MFSQTHHLNSSFVSAASSALQFPLHPRHQGMEWQKEDDTLEFVGQFEFDFEPVKAGGIVDDFSIDDLLDYPETNEDFSGAELFGNGGNFEEGKVCCAPKLADRTAEGNSSGFSPTEISVPADDVAELEWLSNFVANSFSGYSVAYSGLTPPEQKKAELATGALTTKNNRLFPPPLTKPRAKRSRRETWAFPGGSISRSDTTSSSSSSCSTTSSFLSLPPPVKRQHKSQGGAGFGSGSRRCSHCGVQKTPQWRAGPEGAKTLCNACGVRYKSGRLCPEYRPACSPTFSSELHSNQHRKVVEMRRKKEVGDAATTTTRFAPAVQRF